MPLTPETITALKSALDAVVTEAGDDPTYGSLVENLTGATDALDAIGDEAGADVDAPPADVVDDEPAEDAPVDAPPAEDDGEDEAPDTFEGAEKAFGKRLKSKKDAA